MPKEEYQRFISKNAHQILNHHKKMIKYLNLFLDDCEFPDKIWQNRDSQCDAPDAMPNGMDMQVEEELTSRTAKTAGEECLKLSEVQKKAREG